MVFHDGRMVAATWHKGKSGSQITLTNKKGALKVPAGHTWIELVPIDGGNVTFHK
jgi:NADPH-dependent ferric siderophore reductase